MASNQSSEVILSLRYEQNADVDRLTDWPNFFFLEAISKKGF
jgi:hypothetical protein